VAPTATLTTQLVVVNDSVAVLDSTDILVHVKALKEARAMAKVVEKQEKDAKDAIKALLGTARTGLVDGEIRVELKDSTTSRVDAALLKEAYPEAYAATFKTTHYDKIITS
jgi:predicted phage-related endonuclease